MDTHTYIKKVKKKKTKNHKTRKRIPESGYLHFMKRGRRVESERTTHGASM